MRASCTVSSQYRVLCAVSGEVAHGVSIQQEPVSWLTLQIDIMFHLRTWLLECHPLVEYQVNKDGLNECRLTLQSDIMFPLSTWLVRCHLLVEYQVNEDNLKSVNIAKRRFVIMSLHIADESPPSPFEEMNRSLKSEK